MSVGIASTLYTLSRVRCHTLSRASAHERRTPHTHANPRASTRTLCHQTPMDAQLARQRRREAAWDAVFTNTDLVAHILRGHIGPSTLAAVSEVCHAWRAVCRTDERLLRSVALYQGGMTKAKLVHLFALPSRQANALPHSMHARKGGGLYLLFHAPAIDELLGPAGMQAWRQRLQSRAMSPWNYWTPPAPPPRRTPWQEEERLHRLAARRGDVNGTLALFGA